MAEVFDVIPTELHTGAAHLAQDSGDLGGGASDAGAAISQAGAGVPGGALVAALGALGDEAATRCAAMVTSISAAGTTLASNAERYSGDDASAAGALSAQVPW